jgi:two-component system CheB/CheR fusion protein
LGVGLTLVRSLVGMHGGKVTVHSDGEGRGSEFVVRLPVTTVPARPEPAPPPQPRARPRVSAGAKIAIVEDSRDSRELLCELLTQEGFECVTAESGGAALTLVDQVRPAIAILDVGLPEMDGFELARRLRERPDHANLILIALTGYGQAADRAASREAGFDEHLVKPVNVEELLRLLASMRAPKKEDGLTEDELTAASPARQPA